MGDTFKLQGSISVTPSPAEDDPSGELDLSSALYETLVVTGKVAQAVSLDADPAEAVSFGDLTGANVIIVRATGQVTITLTSAAGVAQMFPASKMLVLITDTIPVTAMTLQRVAGVATKARVILLQI